MTLALKSPDVSFAFDTASFFLADGARTIRVDVRTDLLALLSGAEPCSRAGLAERLVRHRTRLAKIATTKYGAGQFRREVNVLVVRIALEDVF